MITTRNMGKCSLFVIALVLLNLCSFAQSGQIVHEEDDCIWVEETVNGHKCAFKKNGETIIPLTQKYDEIKYIVGWWYFVKRDGFVGIWNGEDGLEVISPNEHYEKIEVLRYEFAIWRGSPDCFRVSKNGNVGVVDKSGTTVIPLNMRCQNIVSCGIGSSAPFIVERDGCMGVYSSEGKELISLNRKYSSVKKEEYGCYLVTKECDTGFCNMNGVEIIPPDGSYSRVKLTKYWHNFIISGVRNNVFYSFSEAGDTIISVNLAKSSVNPSECGYLVNTDNISAFYDKTGQPVIPYERGYSEINIITSIRHITWGMWLEIDCFIVQKNGRYGVCDAQGNEIITPNRNYTKIVFSDTIPKRFNVWKEQIQGICDIRGKEVIPTSRKFSSVKLVENLNRRYFITRKDGCQGIYDSKWRELISTNSGYSKAYFDSDNIYVFKSDNIGLCDSVGYPIIPVERGYSAINPAVYGTQHFFYVTKDGLTGICDIKGKEVLVPKYKRLSVFSQGFKNWDDDAKEWQEIGLTIEGDEFVYYDPKSIEKYDKCFKEGNKYFSEKKYNKAASSFKKALKYKESYYAYYNVGVSYYNDGKYSKSITYFNKCLNNKAPDDVYDDALQLKRNAKKIIERKKERRQEILAAVLLGTATAMMQVSAPTPMVSTTPYNMSQVQNQIMQQTLRQTNYDMMLQQQWQQNMEKYASQSFENFKRQQELQNKAEYDAFSRVSKKADGSDYSYDEWMQMKINSYYQAQSESEQTTTENGTNPIQPHQVTKSCPLCHGSGKCPTCNGTHRMNYEFGSGTLECPNCEHDGKCRSCGGTGVSTSTKYY